MARSSRSELSPNDFTFRRSLTLLLIVLGLFAAAGYFQARRGADQLEGRLERATSRNEQLQRDLTLLARSQEANDTAARNRAKAAEIQREATLKAVDSLRGLLAGLLADGTSQTIEEAVAGLPEDVKQAVRDAFDLPGATPRPNPSRNPEATPTPRTPEATPAAPRPTARPTPTPTSVPRGTSLLPDTGGILPCGITVIVGLTPAC